MHDECTTNMLSLEVSCFFSIPFALFLHLAVRVIVFTVRLGVERSVTGAVKGPKTLDQGLHCVHEIQVFLIQNK